MFETKLLQEMLKEEAYLVKVEVKDEGLSFGRVRRNDDNFAEIINRHCGAYATLEEAKTEVTCLCTEMKDYLASAYPVDSVLPDVTYKYDVYEDTFNSDVHIACNDVFDKGRAGFANLDWVCVTVVSVVTFSKYLCTDASGYAENK